MVELGADDVEQLYYSIPDLSNCVVPMVGNYLLKSHMRRKTVKFISRLGGMKQLLKLKVAKRKFGRIKRRKDVGKEVVKGDNVELYGWDPTADLKQLTPTTSCDVVGNISNAFVTY